MKEKDARMAAVTEAVGAIRAIKLHHWEAVFEARIARARECELRTLWRFSSLSAVTSTLWIATHVMLVTSLCALGVAA